MTRARLAATAAALSLLAAPAAASAATSSTAPDTSFTTSGAWTYVSAPNLHPPKLSTDAPKARHGIAPGDFFVSNFKNITIPKPYVGQGGPLIVDSHLQPVWFLPVSGVYANNLTVQTFEGKPALSWWQGVVTNTGATTQGTDIVVDQHYHKVATLTGAPGWVITQHEFVIAGHDAWVTANSAAPVTTPTGPVVDSAVQEYDLRTGKLLFSWSALQNIPLTDSKVPAVPGFPRDAYHVNSIQLLPGGKSGRFLTSMRNTWGAYLVDIATGKIVWSIDGSGQGGSFNLGSFLDPSNTQFQWQHDVELHSNGLLSLFDDACCAIAGPGKFAPPTGLSRGLLLRLNFQTGIASYVHEYLIQSKGTETAFQGNMQMLPNHNVVVGWGSAPFFSEFTYSGKLLQDIAMPSPDVTYRAYKFAGWVGRPPLSAMRQTAKKVSGHTWVYASWDGATQIVSWRVLGGSNAKHLRLLATAVKRSFETGIRLKTTAKTYKVQALDSRGHVLGTSSAFSTGSSSGQIYGGY